MRTKNRQTHTNPNYGAGFLCLLAVMLLSHLFLPVFSYAQCSDYGNYGYSSYGKTAADLEYDNAVSSFHSTIVRGASGKLKIWGDRSKSTTSSSDYSWLTPTDINVGYFTGLTGTPVKGTLGSRSTSIQHIVLTDDNKLWAWGSAGTVVPTDVKSGATISSFPLPSGVLASEVKMLFATYQALVITTCASDGGNVWVMSANSNMRGNSTSPGGSWYKVQKSTGGDLTNIVAARGCTAGLIALDAGGNLWTWGDETYNNSNNVDDRDRATSLPKPGTATGNIKMIGASGTRGGSSSVATYYILYENGQLWAIGDNSNRQLGDWNWGTTNSNTWVRPKYSNSVSASMDDIIWMSPNEHDALYPFINVITTGKIVWNWGTESGDCMGRQQQSGTTSESDVSPGTPANFADGANSNIIAVESGGHTTLIVRECQADFGYVGHFVRGSMGDGRAGGGSSTQSTFSFNTTPFQFFGVPTTDANFSSSPISVNTCRQAPVTLIPSPAGGTFSIVNGGSIASLTGNVLSFTGVGDVTVRYVVNSGTCTQATVNKTFVVVDCSPIVTIPGKVWIDNNGNAKEDGPDGGGTSNGGELWANLVGPDGKVIMSVKVNSDGTFEMKVPKSALSASGNYSVIITNSPTSEGYELSQADTPSGGYGYTGTNRGGPDGNATTGPNANNRTGKIDMGNLSTAGNNSTTAPANFGLSNDPNILPVSFGPIAATYAQGKLLVKWTTLTETNNDYFEIEISKDGTSFTSLGKVNTKATGGNASQPIEYEFSVEGSNMVAFGIGLLALAAFGYLTRRKKNISVVLLVVAVFSFSVAFTGCKKGSSELDDISGRAYVRIVQVNIDGTKSPSKVVTVVSE